MERQKERLTCGSQKGTPGTSGERMYPNNVSTVQIAATTGELQGWDVLDVRTSGRI